MYEASYYSSENEDKLVEICFMKNYTFLLKEWRDGGDLIERGLNKFLHLKRGGLLERGAYLRGRLNKENTVQTGPQARGNFTI